MSIMARIKKRKKMHHVAHERIKKRGRYGHVPILSPKPVIFFLFLLI